jgi:uncharacterized protein YjbI with pentapeptide repeats
MINKKRLEMETKMIGIKISEARKKINISQAQLAEKLFISAQAVGKWERGESLPDIITLNRLAQILGVDLNYFSENFKSVVTENSSDETQGKPPIESATVKTGNKLSWDMSRGNWVGADFSGLKNLHEKFSSSNMQRCRFIGSELSGLLLKGNNINGCDFSGSDICSSRIQSSNLAGNQFQNCSLKETEFLESFISGSDFTGADFTGVKIKSGGFVKNTIPGAIWNLSSFIDTYLAEVVFEGPVEDCYFENCSFKRVTFKNATLKNTFFKNKSLKEIRFIECQADRMTYEFLKNGKADLTGIELIAS